MQTKLKSYTIIPPQFYVKREADRQIKRILSDMGRPGYVLVSRQMGKTNLLLNAKRELESAEDIFVYIDLSNSFESAKQCFRNIIDIAIETNDHKIGHLKDAIRNKRKIDGDLPAHIQHTNELRLILNNISGKLVITLDEIDALTKTQYSDQIFSQIRSIYFSRTNFPELERLTYILSGVVEPSEIIRDPKISPFNIGEKIFLNDFSKTEFDEFIKKASLDISDESLERIFYWTNGNPRITWDVCLEVERFYGEGELITPKTIDQIIENTYLVRFDKPPIDNIRELVKNDSELRNALMELDYDKGGHISDRVKNKLYLSGIINYDEGKNIVIKNNLIKASLNRTWIRSLEEEEKNLMAVGFSLFQKNQYNEAIDCFEKYLLANEVPEDQVNGFHSALASSLFEIGNIPKALQQIENVKYDKDDSAINYYASLVLRGQILYAAGRFSEAITCYNVVLSESSKDVNYIRALINCAYSYINSRPNRDLSIGSELLDKLLAFPANSKISNNDLKSYKSVAAYNKFEIARLKGNLIAAQQAIELSLSYADNISKPALNLALCEIKDSNERKMICDKVIDFVEEHNFIPGNYNSERPLDFNANHFKSLILYLYIDDIVALNRLVNSKLLSNKSLDEWLFEAAAYGVTNDRIEEATRLLTDIYYGNKILDVVFNEQQKSTSLQLLALFNDAGAIPQLARTYINERLADDNYVVASFDYKIFSNYLIYLWKESLAGDAISLLSKIYKKVGKVEIDLSHLLLYNLEMNFHLSLENKDFAQTIAKKILNYSTENAYSPNNFLDATSYDTIIRNAKSIYFDNKIKIPRSYSKNTIVKVIYKDGRILEKQYKRVEQDILQGLCKIV